MSLQEVDLDQEILKEPKETTRELFGDVLEADSAEDDGFDVDDIPNGINKDHALVVDNFTEHLQTMDGGIKNLPTALSHRSVILRMISNLGGIQNLWNRKVLNTWCKKFFSDQGRKPGTLRAYLGSIAFFYDYAIDQKPECLLGSIEEIKSMVPVMKNWGKSYGSLMRKSRTKKKMEDAIRMPTPDEIVRFDNSVVAEEAKRLLEKAAQHGNLQQKKMDYCLGRDFCITYACTDNFQR